MEISVLNEQTVQCVMTEAEVARYGMDKKAICRNDERVRDFFRQVMQKAKRETGFAKERGDVAVHASFLANESLEITFSVAGRDKWQEGAFPAAILKTKSLSDMAEFCRLAPKDLDAQLYKYNRIYFLLADISGYSAHGTAVLFNLADEYMEGVCYTKGIAAFLKEHGTCIVARNAVSVLGGL